MRGGPDAVAQGRALTQWSGVLGLDEVHGPLHGCQALQVPGDLGPLRHLAQPVRVGDREHGWLEDLATAAGHQVPQRGHPVHQVGAQPFGTIGVPPSLPARGRRHDRVTLQPRDVVLELRQAPGDVGAAHGVLPQTLVPGAHLGAELLHRRSRFGVVLAAHDGGERPAEAGDHLRVLDVEGEPAAQLRQEGIGQPRALGQGGLPALGALVTESTPDRAGHRLPRAGVRPPGVPQAQQVGGAVVDRLPHRHGEHQVPGQGGKRPGWLTWGLARVVTALGEATQLAVQSLQGGVTVP